MAKWLLACKEINGTVYVTRLPQTTTSGSGPVPGVPAPWVPIGPGHTPSAQEYSGNQFIVIFEYLSHLVCRVLDVTTWPPVQINPISVAGGPNPSFPFLFNIATGSFAEMPNDVYVFRVPASILSTGQIRNQYDPPYLKKVLIFLDPTTNIFTVELTPDSTWQTNIPNTTNYFRLYRSPLGTPVWTRILDWSTVLDFTDSQTGGPFQFQYAASIGAYWNIAQPGNTADHDESAKGPALAFNSLAGALGFILSPAEALRLLAGTVLTVHVPSSDGYGVFSASSRFLGSVSADTMGFPGLRLGGSPPTSTGATRQSVPTSTSSNMGGKQGFAVFLVLGGSPPTLTPPADAMKFGNSPSHAFSNGGNAAGSIFG